MFKTWATVLQNDAFNKITSIKQQEFNKNIIMTIIEYFIVGLCYLYNFKNFILFTTIKITSRLLQ